MDCQNNFAYGVALQRQQPVTLVWSRCGQDKLPQAALAQTKAT
jgi:hypothetical protein